MSHDWDATRHRDGFARSGLHGLRLWLWLWLNGYDFGNFETQIGDGGCDVIDAGGVRLDDLGIYLWGL